MSRILIVEDDASFRRVLEYQLCAAGYQTTVAETGGQAMELFSAGHYHAVITDLNLPEISGEEVLCRIKQQSPETPVIILTAFGSIQSATQAMKLGAFQYLNKPVNGDELLLTIENAIRLSESISKNRAMNEAIS
jgi:DNA-binding NtrC family response regulator